MSAYAKAIVAVLVSLAGAVVTALGTSPEQSFDQLGTKDWLVAIVAVLGSGGMVWLVTNLPGLAGGIAKALVAGGTAGISSLVVALDDGVINQAEWLTAFSAAVLATGFVYQVANRKPAVSR